MKLKKPVVAIVLDGFGINENKEENPFFVAKMPFWNNLKKNYPMTQIFASEEYVGLPKEQMGGSEVGHLNLGAGECIYQSFMLINKSIENGDFFKNEVLINQMKRVEKNNSTLHLIGMVSDGGIHSSMYHLIATLKMAKMQNVKNVCVHCITDGRDTSPDSGREFIEKVQEEINKIGVGKIVSVCGRFYAMDREQRWNRTEEAFNLYAFKKGIKVDSFENVFDVEYAKKTSDEFIPPYVVGDYEGIKEKDEIFFFNFRPDRMRQLTEAFSAKKFEHFERKIKPLKCVSMAVYDKRFKNVDVVFPPVMPRLTLSKYLSDLGLKQLKVSETTKYAHVTYYFNGGIEKAPKGEDRILIESENVDNFANYPQMKAPEIATAVEKAIISEKYDFILINFSNADMVGHSGNFKAAIKALEFLDKALEKVITSGIDLGYTCVVTADHGNIEDMRVKAGMSTTHTKNPVPFLITNKGIKFKKGKFGLSSFAPTVLDIMGIKVPKEMTSPSLIK
ncbi:MAG: 2,3-bisphosphoglycerate-independent phosphoglycerate mutase [Clostridia bacterium]|nr:2,3-bisphosphoglycerate-independent phosphoglycerate mutase [Clostridia bacterium]